MYNSTLTNLILNFRKGDESSFFEIYRVFEKQINKYSKQCEDLKQALTLFLIELLLKIHLSKFSDDKCDSLQRYIVVSIKHKYIALSKENEKYIKNNIEFDISEWRILHFDNTNVTLLDALSHLTSLQYKVIVYKYLYGYADVEIGQMLGVSRQAVNQIKNRSFKILKKYYEGCVFK